MLGQKYCEITFHILLPPLLFKETANPFFLLDRIFMINRWVGCPLLYPYEELSYPSCELVPTWEISLT